MRYWRKHPKKEGEEALRAIAAMGWRIEDSSTYYKIECPLRTPPTPSAREPVEPQLLWRETVRWAKRVCPCEQEKP